MDWEKPRAVGNPCWASGMDALYYDYGGFQTSDMEDILHAENHYSLGRESGMDVDSFHELYL